MNIEIEISLLLEAIEPEPEKKEFSFEWWIQLAGNIIVVLSAMVILGKSFFYLLNYLSSFISPVWVNTFIQLLKSGVVIVFLVACFLWLTRMIVLIRNVLQPFQILTIYGLFISVKKLAEVAFLTNNDNFIKFIKEFLQKLIE